MAQSFVRVPVDGLGKLIDAWTLTTTGHYRQSVVIGDPATDNNVVNISSRLRLPVELENIINFDTGGGSDLTSCFGIVLPSAVGAAVAGIVGNPLFVRLSDGTNPITTLPISVASLPLPTGAATQATLASLNLEATQLLVNAVLGATNGAKVITDANGTLQQYLRGLVYLAITAGGFKPDLAQVAGQNTISGGVNGSLAIGGNIAHDGVNSGNPSYLGAEAIAYGANPTAVAAADRTKLYSNLAGILHVLAGHPNLISAEVEYTAAQTDTAIITISSGTKIVVTQIQAMLDEATTVAVGLRVGFGASNTPTTTGVILSHGGLVPGFGIGAGDGSGMIGVGADGEDLRITSEVPTTGNLRIKYSYFTVAA